MTLGIDIDDTLVQTNKKALEIIKAEKIAGDITYYEQLDNLSDFISKYFVQIVCTAELFEGAKEVLEWLHSEGNRIIFVTSRAYQRGADTEEDTINYLKEKNIEYDNIYLRTPDKLGVCLSENIDVFIDDKEKILKPLSEAGIRCIKMLSHEAGPSQFETVNCWDEIKELLSKKSNGETNIMI